ncbi:MAG: RIP metalloprotease RseP [Patescibacteria group bacterium]
MTILIFLIVLGILVFIHELGHFLVAKKAGVRVDEFGFGYPPRALKLGKKWGTLFTLNWIPFGGFVKIFGENYEDDFSSSSDFKNLNFTKISKKWQATILAAGVVFNILFAWLLFSLGFLIGLPTSVENDFGAEVKNPALTIVDIVPNSPAQISGLKTGDKIKEISSVNKNVLKELKPEAVSDFINKSSGRILMEIDRGGEILNFNILPDVGIVEGKKIIGINMDIVGILSLPIHKAIYQGGKTTFNIMHLTVFGIGNLIKDAIKGDADMTNIAGPVGIIGLVGDASRLGFAYLLTFTALISINLAIINLVPFPALDGGRILFVIIEGIIKRPINPKFAQIANTAGFALLIALMLFITYRDILRLF